MPTFSYAGSNYIATGAGTRLIQSQDDTGLVGQWSLGTADISGAIVYGKGSSDPLTAVASPTLTTGFDGRANQALSFNGTTQYLTQKVYANKVGAVTMATVATGALFNDTGQDFTPYAGASGNTPYMIVATDTSGYKAWGYIGEEGTGETLGSELVTNWNNESAVFSPNDPIRSTISQSSAQAYSGTYSAKVLSNGTPNTNFYTRVATTSISPIGGLFVVSMWGYNPTGNAASLTFQSTGFPVIGETISTKDAWFQPASLRYTNVSEIYGFGLLTPSIPDPTGMFYYVDDVSVKQILTLPANTGIKIYSTKNGSTQSWAGVDTGFLPNSVASYEVRKADFQITSAITLGTWFKSSLSSGNNQIIMSKGSDYLLNSFYVSLQANDATSYPNGILLRYNNNAGSIGFSTAVNDGVWHLLAATFSSAGRAIYLDGVSQYSNATAVTLNDVNYAFTIGAESDAGLKFNGSIDNPFVYNRALTAAEVLRLYNSQKKMFIQ